MILYYCFNNNIIKKKKKKICFTPLYRMLKICANITVYLVLNYVANSCELIS
jgi:hypothetical protein